MNSLRRTLVALVLGLCGAGCGGDSRPSVVLILVDQLRADAAERWMHSTHALAEQGVRCTEMRAVAPWTYPSVTSLFSGLYPQQHGADANADGTRLSTIADDVPLLPRTLREAGYHTAAFVTNPFFHESNRPVRECFEHFRADFIGDQGMRRGHGELVWTERMWSDHVNPAVRAHFDARARTGPEFVYVHYIDVHGRREGPERWQGAPFEPSYEAAVRHVDEKIRELYDYFLARYDGDVLFVVTSDHGQDLDDDLALGDDQSLRKRKASLHDFNLRIPFFVLPSRLVSAPRVIDEPCVNVDVAPTILEWLGLAAQDGAGTSLLGAIRGEPYDGAARALYARNSTGGRFEECVVHTARKLTRYKEPVAGKRLVDLRADPRETHALRTDARALETLLDRAATEGRTFPARFVELDEDRLKELRELGYAGEDDVPK